MGGYPASGISSGLDGVHFCAVLSYLGAMDKLLLLDTSTACRDREATKASEIVRVNSRTTRKVFIMVEMSFRMQIPENLSQTNKMILRDVVSRDSAKL
jgi:hypothetical protein